MHSKTRSAARLPSPAEPARGDRCDGLDVDVDACGTGCGRSAMSGWTGSAWSSRRRSVLLRVYDRDLDRQNVPPPMPPMNPRSQPTSTPQTNPNPSCPTTKDRWRVGRDKDTDWKRRGEHGRNGDRYGGILKHAPFAPFLNGFPSFLLSLVRTQPKPDTTPP